LGRRGSFRGAFCFALSFRDRETGTLAQQEY
jgi:hypothetical protein